MDFRQFQQKLQIALCQRLPGKLAQQKLAVQPFRNLPRKKITEKRNAAVLILIFPEDDDLKIVLTKRTHQVKHHGGQISFPGGALDLGESIEVCALRETEEEIGISPNSIKIIGNLTPLFVPVSGFKMFPIVGWMEKAPAFKINPTEVEKVILASAQELRNEQNIRSEMHRKYETDFTIPYFALNGEKVWGATAMILSEFMGILPIF